MDTRHVPTLELSQEFDRLCKEKGIVVPQTEFYWCGGEKEGYIVRANNDCPQYQGVIYFPAPLVSELGEWLPSYLHPLFLGAVKSTTKDGIVWLVRYFPTSRIEDYKYEFIAETEADARLQMLNYLIAEGKITTLCQPT